MGRQYIGKKRKIDFKHKNNVLGRGGNCESMLCYMPMQICQIKISYRKKQRTHQISGKWWKVELSKKSSTLIDITVISMINLFIQYLTVGIFYLVTYISNNLIGRSQYTNFNMGDYLVIYFYLINYSTT